MQRDLFHYTCRHAAEMIDGVLVPQPQPFLQGFRLVWLTDLDVPDVDALGLTSHTLTCDRTEVRYRVLPPVIVEPWLGSWIQAATQPFVQASLHRNRQPQHWFISTDPVTVERIGDSRVA